LFFSTAHQPGCRAVIYRYTNQVVYFGINFILFFLPYFETFSNKIRIIIKNKNVAQIPTAEDLLKDKTQFGTHGDMYPREQVAKKMIEFAKLHVKEALKAALEDAPYGSSTDTVSYEDMKVILDSYPDSNIK